MPFTYEKISEPDAKKANWSQYSEYQHPWRQPPSSWMINRELNIYLWVFVGPRPGTPEETFGLHLENETIRVIAITTYKTRLENGKKQEDIYRHITNITPSNNLENIKKTISEIFEAYGATGQRTYVANIIISFDKKYI